MKKLIERWNAEIPVFWKKVKALAVTVTASATAVFSANGTMGLGLSDTVLSICKYAIVAGIVLGLSAQMTKTDTNEK